MSNQLVTETSIRQQPTLITDINPCPRWDSNTQFQQPQTYALEGAATATGCVVLVLDK